MKRKLAGAWVVAGFLAVLAAPAQAASGPAPAAWDPLESVNRSIYAFNAAFGSSVAVKIADAYEAAVPEAVRAGIDNFFTNLREPLTLVSSLLQGDLDNAGRSAGRFAVNSTAGIAGIFDVAGKMNLVSRPTDLGTTLCRYKVPAGPYLVLPFIGPTTARDAAGVAAAYAGAFWLLEDWAPPYIVADRAAAFAGDRPVVADETPGSDYYTVQREQYQEQRAALCSDNPPASLKASPLGKVIETAPHG
jgi:phospholipid-binding lipoprotein MlaA